MHARSDISIGELRDFFCYANADGFPALLKNQMGLSARNWCKKLIASNESLS